MFETHVYLIINIYVKDTMYFNKETKLISGLRYIKDQLTDNNQRDNLIFLSFIN